MDVNDRFLSVLSSIEIQLARSLPVFGGGKETLFFYCTKDISKTEYEITEIRYAAVRDMSSGSITVSKAADIIPADIYASAVGSVNRYALAVEDEIDAEDEYSELYESLLEKFLSGKDASKEAGELSALFAKLTEGSSLVPVYKFFGKEFFDLISAE